MTRWRNGILWLLTALAAACGNVDDAETVRNGEPKNSGGDTADGAGPASTGGSSAVDGGDPTGSGGGSGSDGSGGAGGFGTGVNQEPDGTGGALVLRPLPPRPAWNPSLPQGAPGWRSSTKPFCSEITGTLYPSIFSTKDAVNVLVSSTCSYHDGATCNTPSNYTTRRLYRNDGTGWVKTFESGGHSLGDPPAHLTGFVDGRVVIVDGAGDCPVTFVEPDGRASCAWSGRPLWAMKASVASNGDLFVLGIYPDDSLRSVLIRYHDGKWTELEQFADSGDAYGGLLATDRLVMASWHQTVRTAALPDGALALLPRVPAGDYVSVWSYGAADVVVGDKLGRLLHFDGTKWKTIDIGYATGVLGLWGTSEGELFVRGIEGVGRFKDDTVTPIFARGTSSPYFVDVWGNSGTEVFFAVEDDDFESYECGTLFFVRYDGREFHAF